MNEVATTVTFADHIRELRTRLFLTAGAFLAASSVAYLFRDEVMWALLEPLNGQKLMYLTPAGGFTFIFLVSIYAGLVATVPVLIHQIYSFIKPALPEKSQKYGSRLLLASLILLICGVSFGYFFAIPGALRFLAEFASQYIESALTADSYLNFILGYTLGLGIVFQLPLVVFITHKIKPLTPGGLMKSERWVILLSFVAAAIITPTPDPLNQTIIALPIIVIYQLGVIAVLTSVRNTRRRSRQTSIPIPQPAEALPTLSETLSNTKHTLVVRPTLVPAPSAIRQEQPRPLRYSSERVIDPVMTRRHVRPLSSADTQLAGRLIPQHDIIRPRTPTSRPPRSVDGFRISNQAPSRI